MNVVGYLGALRTPSSAEPTTAALFDAGFRDAHGHLPPNERITSDSGIVIDLIFGRGLDVVEAAVAGNESWVGLSDHVPIWARFRL
jgi:endonuclease/exonuclease/phosphatase family metal-dependent hydrolase